jgi:UDP-2,3-diacylglucosamine pyrophosphatase LpxH
MSVDPDRRFVAGVCARKPQRLLVASDLHLCVGRDPDTATWPATENFLSGDAFADWIDYYLAKDSEQDTLLILNGDTLDFDRICEVPEGKALERWAAKLAELGTPKCPEWLDATVGRSERKYGLRTNDFKSVWKLSLIMRGHPQFFAALGRWVAAGREVVIVAGNHDVELCWPLVREAIRREVRDARPRPGRVLFHHGDLLFENVHIEHGHAHDPMTRAEEYSRLERDDEQLNLPLATFLTRYLINRVEALDPFIDNVKPVQAALLRVVRQRPLRAVGRYWGAWRFVLRAFAMRRVNASVLLIALVLLMPALLLPLYLPEGIRSTVLAWLPISDSARFFAGLAISVLVTGALPYLIGAVNDLRRRRPKRDRWLEAARDIAAQDLVDRRYERAYVCMGHTHTVAVKPIPGADGRQYVNTGTWTALWPADRPDLIARTLLTYACFDRDKDGYRLRVLEWDRHADRPRPATILERERDRQAASREAP